VSTTASSQSTRPPILAAAPVHPEVAITDLDQLVNHLRQATYLEMSSIPIYLYAAFSIGSRGYSQWTAGIGPFRLIRSIVVEEMLHLCLVRNLLVALGHGDDVTFYDPDFVPKYPSDMLHRYPQLKLHLGPCDRDLVRDVFMEFERPREPAGQGTPPPDEYATIGQFYHAMEKGLAHLDAKLGPALWAGNQKSLQYVAAYWNVDGGGEPVLITDLTSALGALKMIVDQGEGIDPAKPSVPIDPLKPVPGLDELPHYTKFKQIADGIDPIGPVWPLPRDPRGADYAADPAARSISDLFNASYCYVLHMLDVIYRTSRDDVSGGNRSPRYHYERTFISAMQGILVSVAEIMVATPLTAGPHADQYHAAPTFEYYELPAQRKKEHLLGLCQAAMAHFPALGGDNSVAWLIGNLPDTL
jgi:hypothetical protein